MFFVKRFSFVHKNMWVRRKCQAESIHTEKRATSGVGLICHLVHRISDKRNLCPQHKVFKKNVLFVSMKLFLLLLQMMWMCLVPFDKSCLFWLRVRPVLCSISLPLACKKRLMKKCLQPIKLIHCNHLFDRTYSDASSPLFICHLSTLNEKTLTWIRIHGAFRITKLKF